MQNQNQFKQSVEKGQLDLRFNSNIITCQIDATSAGNLKPGQAVKIVDSAGGIPKIVEVAADTDNVYGFLAYDMRRASFNAGDKVEVAVMRDNVMYMQSSAAIARDAQVMIVVAGQKVATAAGAGKRIVGRAFDKATGADQLIRVIIDLPGATVPA